MIRQITRDEAFLAIPSQPADECDAQIASDLLDTLKANTGHCVGMAANMIGVSKRIIAFCDGEKYTVMFNPEIIRYADRFETEEGCLSLDGTRKTERWRLIKVQFQNERFQTRFKTYSGWTAQIIQHEIDHLNGIII